MLRNITAIVAALVLLQVIKSDAKSFNLAKDPFGLYFPGVVVENIGINWTDYQGFEKINNFVEKLHEKFPNLTDIINIGHTYEKRVLNVLRISENPEKNKKIWIDGGIHAREWISPATVTYIMYQLLINWENQPEYFRHITWYFLPVMNPDGYEYSRQHDRLWRKNRSPTKIPTCYGIDLNRNFDIDWGTDFLDDPCNNEAYPGPMAVSELETQAVTKFLTQNKKNLVSYVSFHSFGQEFIYPVSFKNESLQDANDVQRVGELAAKRISAKTGSIYNTMLGTQHSGISKDWSHAALNVKYAYTVELRGTGHKGFELPPKQIIPTGQEGLIFVSTIAEAVDAVSSFN